MEWIKTSEQLPEFTKSEYIWNASDWVLVWDKEYKQFRLAYLQKYDEDAEWVDSNGSVDRKPSNYYEHWMPITPPA